ncbi:hypothetical protein ABTN72_19960, partial [Acinetobacter baumannii]
GIENEAVTIPTVAIQSGQKGQYVFVVKPDGTVDPHGVSVDRTVGDVSVIEEGLTGGETVVIDGQLRLAPGSTVVEKQAGAAGPR